MKKQISLLTVIASVCFATATMAQIPPYVSTNGLKGWFPFNGNANDESGNGNNGTANGAVLAADRFANANAAYFFNGAAEISCGTSSSLDLNDCTFSAWVYLSSVTSGWQTIIAKYDANLLGSYALEMYDDKANIWFSNAAGGDVNFNSITSLGINPWYHIAASHSVSSGTKLYINGTLDNSDPTVFNVLQAPSDIFRVGSQGSFYPVPIQNGKIDDIGVWNRPLTQPEITALYVSSLTSSDDHDNEINFSVSPNPVSDLIHVKVNSTLIGSTYTITDPLGKTVMTGKLNTENSTIGLGNLSDGIYMFSVGDNTKQTFKVIINK